MINTLQLTKKNKDEYFAALRLLENFAAFISPLKRTFLKKENDYQDLIM